jgi:hypothetical protein
MNNFMFSVYYNNMYMFFLKFQHKYSAMIFFVILIPGIIKSRFIIEFYFLEHIFEKKLLY